MADKRFKDWTNTATAPADDDYLALDGSTNGTRKMLAGKVALRADANIACNVVTTNPEYVYAIVDGEGKFLFGIKADGSVEWAKGIPNVFGSILNDVSKLSSLVSEEDDDFASVTKDADGKIIEVLQSNGDRKFFGNLSFLGNLVFSEASKNCVREACGIMNDLSARTSAAIDVPSIAYLNFKNISSMPSTKSDDLKGILEYVDNNGKFFTKNVVMNAQGSSSMDFEKKNIAIDICNDEWEGDDTFSIKFGNWVSQDSFHLKAYYCDFFRCVGGCCYDIYDYIVDSRGLSNNVPWKKAIVGSKTDGLGLGLSDNKDVELNTDTGAKCHPLGFPCIVYLNGIFYGIFSFQLKKSKESMHMEKGEAKHIHLDGVIDEYTLFGGNIDWTQFEIRNPKTLANMDGSKYDGDNPKEIYSGDSTDKKCVLSTKVKASIVRLSNAIASIEGVVSTYGINSSEFKAAFEEYFDLDNLIDYIIFNDVVGNYDSYSKNWQWATYDGNKWWVCPYDLDLSFGTLWDGSYLRSTTKNHVSMNVNLPNGYIFRNAEFKSALEARFAKLRNEGVINANKIVSFVNGWISRIGIENYKLEFSKWKDTPCNNDFVVSSYWELDSNVPSGSSSTYSKTKNYVAGDSVYYGANERMGFYKFVCKTDCNGIPPIVKFRFHDSLWRLEKWVEQRMEEMDEVYNYSK